MGVIVPTMAMIVLVVVRARAHRVIELHHEAHRMERAAPHALYPRGPARNAESPHLGEDRRHVGAGVDERGHEHVAGEPADRVDPRALHAPTRARFTREAAYAAPKPLSMFTTVTPGAQLLSMARSAARPPNEAP